MNSGSATNRVLLTALVFALVSLHPSAAKTLDIWFIDVEGGQSTLIVSPSGESSSVKAA